MALANRIPVTPEDAGGLRATLSDAGLDTDLLADLELVDLVGMPSFAMASMNPAHYPDRIDDEIPYTLDLTSDAAQYDDVDSVDRAVMAEVESEGGGPAVGLWRTWRAPDIPTPWPPPRRLYLVQASAAGQEELPALAARRQRALAAAGGHPASRGVRQRRGLAVDEEDLVYRGNLVIRGLAALPVRLSP